MGKNYLGNLKNRIQGTTDKGKAIKIIENKVIELETKIKNKKLDTKTALKLLEQLTCI